MSPIKIIPPEIISTIGDIRSRTTPKQGWTSDVVIVHTDRGRFAIKRAIGHFAVWLEQEYHILQTLSQIDLQIPTPYRCLATTSNGEREYWVLMSALPGDTVRAVFQKEVMRDHTLRQQVLFQWGKSLSTLHASPVPQEWAEQSETWIDRMLKKAELHLQKGITDGGTPALLEELHNKKPAPVKQMLIHVDFTIDNTLLADTKISGIIDWSGGAYGDPRYDLVLATRSGKGVVETPADRVAFFAGYGCQELTHEEINYFETLYRFF